MENKESKVVSVAYKLYVEEENGLEMMEEATAERPFQFITGFGVALDAFEQQVKDLEKGQTFDFVIPQEQAYGDYLEENVLDLARDMFVIDGQFDKEHIYEDAIIPLQNETGQRFFGRVVEIGKESVKVDMNHPLAGETLHFKGTVLENRIATTKEVEQMLTHLTGGCSCHGGEGGCHQSKDGGCDCQQDKGGGCCGCH